MNAVAETGAAARHTAVGTDALCLTEIFDPEVQLVLWQRRPLPPIIDYLDAARPGPALAWRTTLQPQQQPALTGWPDAPGRAALAADIAYLNELYADLLGCQQVGVRLEVMDEAMCPRFHVDRVGIRLLCTYRGPGTQWLDDGKVDRRLFQPSATPQSPPPSGDAQAESTSTFTVVLLKGSLWQGNRHRGIIHRSPALSPTQSPRVVVAMDAIWP